MVTLREAFEAKMKLNPTINKITNDFNAAYGDSKYQDLELPDEIVECLDYGNGKMSWQEFKMIMDRELEITQEEEEAETA